MHTQLNNCQLESAFCLPGYAACVPRCVCVCPCVCVHVCVYVCGICLSTNGSSSSNRQNKGKLACATSAYTQYFTLCQTGRLSLHKSMRFAACKLHNNASADCQGEDCGQRKHDITSIVAINVYSSSSRSHKLNPNCSHLICRRELMPESALLCFFFLLPIEVSSHNWRSTQHTDSFAIVFASKRRSRRERERGGEGEREGEAGRQQAHWEQTQFMLN